VYKRLPETVTAICFVDIEESLKPIFLIHLNMRLIVAVSSLPEEVISTNTFTAFLVAGSAATPKTDTTAVEVKALTLVVPTRGDKNAAGWNGGITIGVVQELTGVKREGL